MKLIYCCMIALYTASGIAGQEREGLSGLVELIKTEVSNQLKIESETIKEEIMKEIRREIEEIAIKDRKVKDIEKDEQDEFRKSLDNTLQGI